MKVGSLFSGIGGFDLGLERAGMQVAWQVEVDPYCQRVLAKHWPAVPRYGDIRKVDWRKLEFVDCLVGGFPCQPFSTASHGRRTAHSLWSEMSLAVAIQQPTWVIIENVAGAVNLAFWDVATDLEASGYEVAPPLEIPACAVGLDHWRPRYWILAHSNGYRKPSMSEYAKMAELQRSDCQFSRMGETDGIPTEMDRRRMLGNAIVPQIAEALGRMILEVEL